MSSSKFYVSCSGDPSVGMAGASAEVTFHHDVSADDILLVKEALQKAFEAIWDDDVGVYTQAEMEAEFADDDIE